MCYSKPEGWFGPVELKQAMGETPPSCDSAAEFSAFSGLSATAASCECTCGEADVTCPSQATLRAFEPGNGACGTTAPRWTATVTAGCNDTPDVESDEARLNISVSQPSDLPDDACTASESTMIPGATWNQSWTGCSADASSSDCELCGDHIAGLCIWTQGDVSCDLPGFSERTLLHESVNDTRGCSACTCGEPQGFCRASATIRSGFGTCGLANQGSIDSGGPNCQTFDFARSADVDFYDTFTCAPADVTAEGDATPSEPVTVCCAP
jgi:hypothetical protein